MHSKEIIKKANDAINKWATSSKKLVVAIDGYSGAGKTTFLNQLAQLNPKILPVYKDDFLVSRESRAKHLPEFEDQSVYFELFGNDYEKLETLVTKFKSSNEPCTIKIFNGGTGRVDVDKTFDFSKRVLV
ncbi:hypothetical protein KJ784_04275, partial [Patescibacteria group bacterium]|nr:hypothetical protein [Patescibacteria group bacterium]